MAMPPSSSDGNDFNEIQVDISPARRAVFVGLGVIFVALAGVGVILPGIPTVGPLLLGSYFLTRSHPALEKRLIRNRFFGKFLPYLDGKEELPWAAKLTSIATMWASISISVGLLVWSQSVPLWVPLTVVLAGIVGTIFILRFGKPKT